MSINKPNIANVLNQRLNDLELKKADLARAAEANGLASRRMVFGYLKGEYKLSWDVAVNLAAALGIELKFKFKKHGITQNKTCNCNSSMYSSNTIKENQ